MAVRARTLARCAAALLAWSTALGCGSEDSRDSADPGAVAPQPNGASRLNVVLITLDTTRADALGLYGNERETTPEIDRFGVRGVVFEQAYTTQPSTLPSHATIMTGRLPFAHGARANAGYVLAYDNETLAEVFSRNGYVAAAEIAAPVIGRRTQLDQGFESYRDPSSFDIRRKAIQVLSDSGFERRELVEREATDITRRGVEFLRRNVDAPFFLWLHYFDPHSFYVPPSPWNNRFTDLPYYAEVHFTDYNVGRVIEAIRMLGLSEQTLVVITADHGEGLDEHDEPTHSYYVYDSTMRVPLVFVLPGRIEGGRRIAQPVRTADIAPTLLDLAGLPPLADIQGVSLAPLLLGHGSAPELDVYGESFEPLSMFGTNVLRFLRRGKWKYIHKVNPELYDLSSDPSELSNLAAEHPDRVNKLRRDLVDWVRKERVEHADDRAVIDDETLSQLNALGYMGEGAPTGFREEADLVGLRGVDPVTRLGDMAIYSYAFAAVKARELKKARAWFEQLYAKNPASLPIVRGLIRTLEGDDRLERAPALLEKAKQLEPNGVPHFIRLGEVYRDLGKLELAENELRQALVIESCNTPARVVLAEMLREWGRFAEQKSVLEAGIEYCEDDVNFRNDLAYLLATVTDGAIRDGAQALRIAKQVVKEMDFERPDYLDTLACAWAEVGNFRKAVRYSKRAVQLIESREENEEVVAAYRAHLKVFEDARPVRGGG